MGSVNIILFSIFCICVDVDIISLREDASGEGYSSLCCGNNPPLQSDHTHLHIGSLHFYFTL